MRLKFNEVYSIIDGKPHNISDQDIEIILDWIHIVETSSIKRPAELSSVCYFAVYETDPNENGWYNQGFDNRTKVMNLFLNNKEWFFIVEDDQLDLQELIQLGCKIIAVKNIRLSVKKVFDKILDMVKPVVIGVTGSVGKTTCVALLEDVLNCYGKTLRIYSKRLSPFSIITAVVNMLEKDHVFIVTEYSLYRSWHIEALTELLKPYIGVILNIEGSHLGIDGINSKEDIFKSKSKLLEVSNIGIMSSDLRDYNYKNPVSFFGINDKSKISFNLNSKKFFVESFEFNINLPILTKLSVRQVLATLAVLNNLDLEITQKTILTIEAFRPKENRLSINYFNSTRLIFDGEMTNASRLVALGENYYDNSVLLIIQQNHGDEPLEPQKEGFSKIRNLFKKIYVLNSIEKDWFDYFKEFLIPDSIISENELVNILNKNKTVFIHAGGYFRFGSKITLPFSV